jgi:hypothetical protein
MVRVILATLAVLCVLSSDMLSQTRMGFHGGTHVATLSRAQHWNAEWDWLRRPSVGVSFDLVISDGFLAVVQIDLVQKWTGLNESPFTEPASYTVYHTTLKCEYFDIPIYLRWRPSNTGVRWFAEVGPRVSLLISSQADMTLGPDEVRTRDVKEQMSSADFGITVGSGLEIDVSRAICLTVATHYTHSLVPVFRESANNSKLIGIQGDIGVMFVL